MRFWFVTPVTICRTPTILRALACLAVALLVACGARDTPPIKIVDILVPSQTVTKVRTKGSEVVFLEERLTSIFEDGPQRTLAILQSDGRTIRSYMPPGGWSMVDFAVHPSGDISAILTTAREVRIVRLDANGSIRSDQQFLDPAAATDPFFNYAGGIKDDDGLQPVLMHDAARLAPLGESLAVVLRTGRNAIVAYRLEPDVSGAYQRSWRTLIEPGSSIFGLGITSGSFDVFGQLQNHLRIFVDVDINATLAIGVVDAPMFNFTFRAHTDYFGEPIAASIGVLLTRVASADGRRLGSTVIDTHDRAELHGLRAVPRGFMLVGRVLSEVLGVTGPNSTVIPDAVAELTLQTNQYNAETGHSSGGQFNLVTKSGTNKLHGSAYEYFQNRNLNATDNLTKAAIASKTVNLPMTTIVSATSLLNPRRAQDTNRIGEDRSNSDLDVRHKFALSLTYETPPITSGNSTLKTLLNEYNLGVVYLAQSGQPITIQSGQAGIDSNGNGDTAGDRGVLNPFGTSQTGSDVIPVCANGNGTTSLAGDTLGNGGACPGSTIGYLAADPSARYLIAGPDVRATLGRNSFRSPGFGVANLSVGKKVKLTESAYFQLKADFYNVLNHKYFTISNGNVFSTTGVTAATSNPGYESITDPNFLNPKIFSGGNRQATLTAKFVF
jgi:hypothetical protein